MKISSAKLSHLEFPRPTIFIDGGFHAREWISPAVAAYLVRILSSLAAKGESELVKDVDYYIVPLVNPDGYEFTHESPEVSEIEYINTFE